MKCPVCEMDCVKSAKDILASLPTIFLPCAECNTRVLDKRAPLPDLSYGLPCSCGKRFIDEVFAHMYVIMVKQGDLKPSDPLIAVGTPLVNPGYAMDRPPFLPEKSLVLLSSRVTKPTADILVRDVPEVRGIVKSDHFTPGIADPDLNTVPKVYDLLAGCDVRADVFPLWTGPLVMYKQQSLIHIEFPRGNDLKIRAVEKRVGKPPVNDFIDACSGAGTLGLTAACLGVPHVVMNDAWYASAFWSAFNLEVNRDYLKLKKIRVYEQYQDLQKHPVAKEPVKIAETEGEQVIEVYQGDFRLLYQVLSAGSPLSAIDVFDKNDKGKIDLIQKEWLAKVGGEVFIP